MSQLSGGYEYGFDYEQIQYVPPDPAYVDVPAARTSVYQPDGTLHVYTFNYRGDPLDHRFRLSRDRTYRVVTTERRFDAEGNTVEAVGPSGVRQLFTYDDSNPETSLPWGRLPR